MACNRIALLACVLLSTMMLASADHEVCSTAYEEDDTSCTGAVIGSGCAEDGACFGTGTPSGTTYSTLECSSAGNWTLKYYGFNAGCTGAPVIATGSGSSCTLVNLGIVSLNFRVECDSHSCFSAASTLTLEDGSVKTISDVRVGDRVLAVDSTGNPFFDKVFRVTHHEPSRTASFVRITTTDGAVLELTPNHELHVGTCCDLSALKPAADVRAGDFVYLVTSSSTATPVTVATVEKVSAQGVFNVHTLSGSVVVNNIAASHFSSATTWTPSSRWLAPYWYQARDALSFVLGAEDASQH